VHAADPHVGPRCIVVLRNRDGSSHKWGSRHEFYSGTTRDATTPVLPHIGNGLDWGAIARVMMPHTVKMFQRWKEGKQPPELNDDAMNAELALLPDKPDEDLC
jgi:hypothetical protein